MKKPLPDRISELKAHKDRLTVRLNALESKAKKEGRKRDTRCKIVVAGVVIAHMRKDHAFATWLLALLDGSSLRPHDREAIALLLSEFATLKAK